MQWGHSDPLAKHDQNCTSEAQRCPMACSMPAGALISWQERHSTHRSHYLGSRPFSVSLQVISVQPTCPVVACSQQHYTFARSLACLPAGLLACWPAESHMFSSSAKRPAYPARGKGFHWQQLGPYTCSMGEAGGRAASSSCAVSWGHPAPPTGCFLRCCLRGGAQTSTPTACGLYAPC